MNIWPIGFRYDPLLSRPRPEPLFPPLALSNRALAVALALDLTAREAVRTGGVRVHVGLDMADGEEWTVRPGVHDLSGVTVGPPSSSCVGMRLRWGRMTSLAWGVVRADT